MKNMLNLITAFVLGIISTITYVSWTYGGQIDVKFLVYSLTSLFVVHLLARLISVVANQDSYDNDPETWND